MRVNPGGIAFLICIGVAGYCFGGSIGLGVAAVLGALVQFF